MSTRAASLEDYLELIRRALLDCADRGKHPKHTLTDDEIAVAFYDGVGSHHVVWFLMTGRWAAGTAPATFVILDGYGDVELKRVQARTDYGALQAYTLGEGFAPYGPEEIDESDAGVDELTRPMRHPLTGRLWAPFTNYEITAERAADVDRFEGRS